MEEKFKTFRQFYPFYLSEHQNKVCLRLHFMGTALVIFIAVYVLLTFDWWVLILLPVFGYGFAWIGHFVFEKNRPATFQYPLFSLRGDFVMFKDILIGKIKL
ncbi:MAG: Mpo1-like protein [Ignavibacteriaceae bacterium]